MGACGTGKHLDDVAELKAYTALSSGAVTLPGGVDRQGRPLVIFPKTQHHKLAALKKQDIADLFQYFSYLLNSCSLGSCSVSVVVDLRTSTKKLISGVVNSLLYTQNELGIVISAVYAVQPEKRALRKFLRKASGIREKDSSDRRCKYVLLNKPFELFSYIDQSHLTSEFGGPLVYEHENWLNFWKEMDMNWQCSAVFNTLPSSLPTLQRVDCRQYHIKEQVQEQSKPLENVYLKRMAESTQMSLLWKQASEQAGALLQKTEGASEANQIIHLLEQSMTKCESFKLQLAGSDIQAKSMREEYAAEIYKPAMCLLDKADKVIKKLQSLEGSEEEFELIIRLCNLQMSLFTAVDMAFQSLQTICEYYYLFNKAVNWYHQVLGWLSFKDALWDEMPMKASDTSGVVCTSLPWRIECYMRLTHMPPQNPDEWADLAKLSDLFPEIQRKQGTLLSSRCLLLWNILTSSTGQVQLSDLQQVMSWQQTLCSSSIATRSSSSPVKRNSITEQLKTVNGIGPALEIASGKKKDSDLFVTNNVVLNEPSSFASGKCSKLHSGKDLSDDKMTVSASCLMNPWLSLPLVDFAKSSNTPTHWQKVKETRDAHEEVLSLAHDKERENSASAITNVCDNRLSSKSTATQVCNAGTKRTVAYCECGVQTDISSFKLYDPYPNPYDLERDAALLSSTLNEQDGTDPKQSIVWDSYDLHISRRLMESNHTNHILDDMEWLSDWDLKEQDDLCYIEKLLKSAEAILKEEEVALREERELEYLVYSEEQNSTDCGSGGKIYREMNSTCQIMPLNLLDNAVTGGEKCSYSIDKSKDFTPDVKASIIHTNQEDMFANSPRSNDHSIYYPEDTAVKAQTYSADLFGELKEMYAIDERICEENRKIVEFRDMEHSEDRQKQEATFNTTKEKLLFLAQLQRERNEVDELEQSLAKEEAKKHKYLRKKIEIDRIKKYCLQAVAKENARLSELKCGNCVLDARSTMFSTCVQSNEGGSSNTHTRPCTMEKEAHGVCNVVCTPAADHVPSELLQDRRIVEGSEMTAIESHYVGPKALTPGPSHLSNTLMETFASRASTFNPGVQTTLKYTNIPPHKNPTVDLEVEINSEQCVLTHKECTDFPKPCITEVTKRDPFLPVHSHNVSVQSNKKNKIQRQESYILAAERLDAAPCLAEDESWERIGKLCLSTLESTPVVMDSIALLKPVYGERVGDAAIQCKNVRVPPLETYLSRYQSHLSTVKPIDYSIPIILDIGSGLVKAGFSNQELPNTVFPAVMGLTKMEDLESNPKGNIYIGHETQHPKTALHLMHLNRGIPTNWKDLEKIWHYTFYNQLHVDPREHPVMLTDTIMNLCENRKQMVQIMFEVFNVPFVYVALQAVLALYSTGRTTGVVFHSGDTASYSVPVHEAYSLPHAVQKLSLAGQDLTSYLAKLLKEKGLVFGTIAEQELIRDLKEKWCYVAKDPDSEPASDLQYTLPDGQTITLGSERYRASEVLFSPQLSGKDQYGVHESLLRSLLLSDMDLRKSFAGNIILSGGTTLLPGLASRLQKEVSSMLPLELLDALHVSRVLDKDFAVWCGGAALASSQGFHTAWISKQEYHECGPDIVHRRCF
ncbi:hypothetical protein FKM82_011033 [Ascaphus truei]